MTILLLLALLAFSASFSSLETALFSITPLQRFQLKEIGGVTSLIYRALGKPREFLTTVLMGNELLNVAISIIAGSLAYETMTGFSDRTVYFASTAVTTIIILIFGEIAPKNIAIRIPILVAQVLIVPYVLFSWIVYPIRVVLSKISDTVVQWFGVDPVKERRLIVEEELRSLLEHGKKEGTLADLERTLIQNALDFSALQLFQSMTQRENIIAIPVETPLSDIFNIIQDKRFSRYPVYDKDFNNVIGILHAKELLQFRLSPEAAESFSLRELLKPAIEVSPKETLDSVFQIFQHYRVHMAVVKDPTDKVIGLITMDDLLRRFFS